MGECKPAKHFQLEKLKQTLNCTMIWILFRHLLWFLAVSICGRENRWLFIPLWDDNFCSVSRNYTRSQQGVFLSHIISNTVMQNIETGVLRGRYHLYQNLSKLTIQLIFFPQMKATCSIMYRNIPNPYRNEMRKRKNAETVKYIYLTIYWHFSCKRN